MYPTKNDRGTTFFYLTGGFLGKGDFFEWALVDVSTNVCMMSKHSSGAN